MWCSTRIVSYSILPAVSHPTPPAVARQREAVVVIAEGSYEAAPSDSVPTSKRSLVPAHRENVTFEIFRVTFFCFELLRALLSKPKLNRSLLDLKCYSEQLS